MLFQKFCFIFFLFAFVTSFAQKKPERIVTTFKNLDKTVIRYSSKTGVTCRELFIQEIVFQNFNLDTIRSKPYLDSIVWFLQRNLETYITLRLDSGMYQFNNSQTCFRMQGQIKGYIVSRGVFHGRIDAEHNSCLGCEWIIDGPPHGKFEKNEPKRIQTKILYCNDYLDPKEPANKNR